MNQLSIKSTFSQKIRRARSILLEEGLSDLSRAVWSSLVFHLHGKWQFVYYALSLEGETASFGAKGAQPVRIAAAEDMERIEAEIFPALGDEHGYEKRYFQFLGQPDVRCFLGEIDGKLVHYSWLFLDASRSLLAEVPFDKRKLNSNDAFIGPVFTNPDARGLIYFQVFSAILDYLKHNTQVKRVIVFVDGRNQAAPSFYQRLGFSEIPDAQPRSVFSAVWRGLSRTGN